VKWYGKYGKKTQVQEWKDLENMEEIQIELSNDMENMKEK
jgi:hypothetical protein